MYEEELGLPIPKPEEKPYAKYPATVLKITAALATEVADEFPMIPILVMGDNKGKTWLKLLLEHVNQAYEAGRESITGGGPG